MKPWRANGTTYGYDAEGKRIATGSAMGRRDILPDDPTKLIKLRMERLRFVDGDYDQGGAYWGQRKGTSIYCAYADGVQVFVRASSRGEAKKSIRESVSGARFYN